VQVVAVVEQIKTLVQQEVQVAVEVVQVVYQLQQVDLELHVKEMLEEEHPIQLLLQVAVEQVLSVQMDQHLILVVLQVQVGQV
tara:strand:+ start:200 stop:448 length:249 start_codon:yes stop_codon:yes gene_type:complete